MRPKNGGHEGAAWSSMKECNYQVLEVTKQKPQAT